MPTVSQFLQGNKMSGLIQAQKDYMTWREGTTKQVVQAPVVSKASEAPKVTPAVIQKDSIAISQAAYAAWSKFMPQQVPTFARAQVQAPVITATPARTDVKAPATATTTTTTTSTASATVKAPVTTATTASATVKAPTTTTTPASAAAPAASQSRPQGQVSYTSAPYISKNVVATVMNDGGGASFLPDDQLSQTIQDEIDHIHDLYHATSDDAVKQQLHVAADALREIGTNGNRFNVIRLNGFIASDEVMATIPTHTFHGDGRDFDKDSTASRVSQYIVVNLDSHKVTAANFVGRSSEYDSDGNLVETDTAKNTGMSVSSEFDDWGRLVVNTSAHVANPLSRFAPTTDFSTTFKIDLKDGSTVGGAQTDGYPSMEGYERVDAGSYQTLMQYKTDGDGVGQILKLLPVWGDKNFSFQAYNLDQLANAGTNSKGGTVFASAMTGFKPEMKAPPRADDLVRMKMEANSNAWKTASAADQQRLHDENVRLGQLIGATYNATSGAWSNPSAATAKPSTTTTNSQVRNAYVAQTSNSSTSTVSQSRPSNTAPAPAQMTEDQIRKQMASNSNAWKTASAADQERLHKENEKLGQMIGAAYNNTSGAWTSKPTASTPSPSTTATSSPVRTTTAAQVSTSSTATTTSSPARSTSSAQVSTSSAATTTNSQARSAYTTQVSNNSTTTASQSRPSTPAPAPAPARVDEDQVRKQMAANSAAWKNASTAEQQRLHDENVRLGSKIGGNYNSSAGTWSYRA